MLFPMIAQGTSSPYVVCERRRRGSVGAQCIISCPGRRVGRLMLCPLTFGWRTVVIKARGGLTLVPESDSPNNTGTSWAHFVLLIDRLASRSYDSQLSSTSR